MRKKKFFIIVALILIATVVCIWYNYQKRVEELNAEVKTLVRGVYGILAVTGKLPKTHFLSEEKVLMLANKEAVRLGYDIKSMNVEIDRYNTAWNKFISKNPSYLEDNADLEDKLKNGYWAVYYGPKRLQFGGDLWVFVDPKTGEIITVIRGK